MLKEKVMEGIVVIGGDGTLHEVMNGLKVSHLSITFIPGGFGNDFARSLGIKKRSSRNIASN